MLRYLATILLLLSIGMQTFRQSMVIAGYYLNNAAYARTCENKAKPQLKCAGKCQMMKQLYEEEQKEQQLPGLKAEHKLSAFTPQTFFTPTYNSIANSKQPDAFAYTTGIPVSFAATVFHPPAIA